MNKLEVEKLIIAVVIVYIGFLVAFAIPFFTLYDIITDLELEISKLRSQLLRAHERETENAAQNLKIITIVEELIKAEGDYMGISDQNGALNGKRDIRSNAEH
jgi:hypothetical protein